MSGSVLTWRGYFVNDATYVRDPVAELQGETLLGTSGF